MSEASHGWTTEEVLDLLKKVEFFEGLPADDLAPIAAIVRGEEIESGEVLFEEGEPGEDFYIVFEGAIEISKARSDGTDERLAIRRTGDAFGEMALLNDAPRSATARATQSTKLMAFSRGDFEVLLGGDTLALRLMRILSKSLRALGIRFASTQKLEDRGTRTDVLEVSRVMQAGMLPRSAPRVEGFEVAAGTTTEPDGRGASVWDWMDLGGGRTAILSIDVGQDGFPPAYHIGATRAVLRSVAGAGGSLTGILARANDALAGAAVEGLDQFVEVGIMVVDGSGIEWGSAGRVPGGMIRRDGTFDQFGANGPPLGMMPGFNYKSQRFEVNAGDTAFVLSHGSQGLFLGAADLLAQLHGKPAGEIVSSLHKAIRKAQGEERTETSVLYVRKH